MVENWWKTDETYDENFRGVPNVRIFGHWVLAYLTSLDGVGFPDLSRKTHIYWEVC
jgi:hypothetical protein